MHVRILSFLLKTGIGGATRLAFLPGSKWLDPRKSSPRGSPGHQNPQLAGPCPLRLPPQPRIACAQAH